MRPGFQVGNEAARGSGPGAATEGARRWTSALSVLLALFALRVAAQAVQSRYALPWLPPFEAWHSGALPYWALAAAQFAILALAGHATVAVARGRMRRNQSLGGWLLALGAVYFVSMAARLALGASRLAGHGWFDAPLPSLFHLVLACFILVMASYHRSAGTAGDTTGR